MEIWKEIKGYEGIYEVSNLGNIKSLNFKRTGKERLLKGSIGKYYLQVSLCKNGKRKTRNIHQLVAEAFLEHNPCGYELVVDHINTKDPNNKLNNRVENLRIVTQRVNTDQKHFKNTSKYTGVFWNKRINKWVSSIYIKGKTKHLGCFADELEAYLYYENAVKNNLLGLPFEAKRKEWSSNYKGVFWSKNKKKWEVQIAINGKRKYLGSFITEIEAYNAVLEYKDLLQKQKK